jgi:hypothetical protein
MANDEVFDPFDLQGGEGNSKTRPVLIAVSQGNADPRESNGGAASSTSSDPFADPFSDIISDVPGSPSLAQQQLRPVEQSLEQYDDAESTGSPSLPPEVTRVTRSTISSSSKASPSKGPLPPKLHVKLTLHEEVSSVAKTGPNNEGSSEVSVEGIIYAQVQSSDAKKNAPFALMTPVFRGGNLNVRPNSMFATGSGGEALHVVKVPKHEIGKVAVAYYSLTEEVRHMPILVERKVTVHDTSVRVAIQVRSKLTNQGDMKDFTIAVAIPERVDGESIQILRGLGTWDELKRTVKWKLDSLDKGESFMVSAQAKLWTPLDDGEQVAFPAMLRCTSAADQIGSIDFQATGADGYPASVTSSTAHSFRLLHRLT